MHKDEFKRPEYNNLLTGRMSEVRDDITVYRKRMYKYIFLNWWAVICIWLASIQVILIAFAVLVAVFTGLSTKHIIKRAKLERELRVLTEMLNVSRRKGSALLMEFEQDAAFALNALNALSEIAKKGSNR